LDIPEKTRLEKLLGMLGSSFDGERANAAQQRLTVVELIYGARAQHQGRQQHKPRPEKDDPRRQGDAGHHAQGAG
jgi:hypothetical protein